MDDVKIICGFYKISQILQNVDMTENIQTKMIYEVNR